MFTAAELIDALRRRLRRSIRPLRPAGEFPAGWQAWFDRIKSSPRKPGDPRPDPLIEVLLARTPLAPAPFRPLTRWQVAAYLLRGSWEPPPREERGMRWAAAVLTLAFHAFWVGGLIWLMSVWFTIPEMEEARRGENVVQVEYIGEGTPDEDAGGAGQGDHREMGASPVRAPATVPDATPRSVPPQPIVVEETPVPESSQVEVTAPVAPQPLRVTEVAMADEDAFVLPPPPDVAVPGTASVRLPVLRAPDAEVRRVDVPSPPPIVNMKPQPELRAPQLLAQETEVVMRDIPQPLPGVEMPTLRQPAMQPQELRAETREVEAREIALRVPAGSTSSSDEAPVQAAAVSSATASTTAATAAGATQSGSGPRPVASVSGAGRQVGPQPGGLPSARRADDWGDSSRNVPGGQRGTPGLFNADGSPRLTGGGNRAGGGLPPGTVLEDYEKIDRMGTWLKRPPTDYEPTSFDRFWVPNETLLEEWVRRGIKTVEIPIPGTGKRLACAISLLQLGGGCGIRDPNMVDVEAGARPPPDIPFKRDLQEDQESLGRDPPSSSIPSP